LSNLYFEQVYFIIISSHYFLHETSIFKNAIQTKDFGLIQTILNLALLSHSCFPFLLIDELLKRFMHQNSLEMKKLKHSINIFFALAKEGLNINENLLTKIIHSSLIKRNWNMNILRQMN
jgi:hypothetical protein